jgi:PEP-CTERM motif-containing protein
MRDLTLTLSALRSVLLLVGISAFSIVEVQTAHATPLVPVRSLYLVPSDRAPNPDYAAAIDAALFDLQAWYAGQLGGPTFGIATPNVEIVSTALPASYYSTPRGFPGTSSDFFFNVFEEATSVGVVLDDPAFRWAVYIDAEPGPGQFGGAALGGVTVIAAPDLRGLIGQEPAPVSRWIGGLGHELGHTFGLPHPNDCLAPFPAGDCPYNQLNYPLDVTGGALMQFGYLTYPNTYLLPEERQFLRTTPYIGRSGSPTPVPEPASLVLLLAGAGATACFRRRSRRTR